MLEVQRRTWARNASIPARYTDELIAPTIFRTYPDKYTEAVIRHIPLYYCGRAYVTMDGTPTYIAINMKELGEYQLNHYVPWDMDSTLSLSIHLCMDSFDDLIHLAGPRLWITCHLHLEFKNRAGGGKYFLESLIEQRRPLRRGSPKAMLVFL